MLTTLALIHSCTYNLAELDFRHGQSMQLVGGNNVGKSSVIHALNFLFVIDRRRMSFVGDHKADKTTMEYYFPEAEGSFVIFEISKRGHTYCIIVWRDGVGNPNYARLHHAYDRSLFFDTDDAGDLQSLKLTALKKRWVLGGLKYEELRNQREVFKTVYHTGRANNAVVWLRNSGHGRAEEGFSKLYRYLIDTRLINMDALREILMLADHRRDTELQYGKSNLNDVERLRKLRARVETLQSVSADFERFRADFRQLSMDQELLADLALHFQHHCTRVRAQMQDKKARRDEEIATTKAELTAATNKQITANQAVGEARAEQESLKREATRVDKQVANIAALPDLGFLQQGVANLQDGIDLTRLQLKELQQSDQSPGQLERRVSALTQQLAERRQQRDNISNWLVLRLAKSDEDRRRLYALLDKDVARSSAAAVEPISATDNPVKLFDGAFNAPDLELPELPSPESIEQEITELEAQLMRLQSLLETAKNRAAVEAELREKKTKLGTLNNQISLRNREPELRAESEKIRGQITAAADRHAVAAKEARLHAETEERHRKALSILQNQEEVHQRRGQKIMQQLQELERFNLDTDGREYSFRELTDDRLDGVFKSIKQQHQDLKILRVKTSNGFQMLRRSLLSETADEEKFIAETETEYAGVADQDQAISSLIDNISQRFASPAADLLNEYEKFRDFINKQFNRALAKQKISNIEQLRIELVDNRELVEDLRKISQMELGGKLFGRDTAGMRTLRKYIERGRTISFSNLFSLQLKLTVNGKDKIVDLSKQIESDGTDRMLRLVIVMQVIRRLAELGPENRVVVFIDEIATIDGKNRPQLVRFCAENHFYPIFAAPEMVEGFNRYVMISRARDGSLIVDRNKHYIDAERN